MTVANPGFERRDTIDFAAVAIMVGLTFSWGFNGVAIKVSSAGYGPIFMVLARSAIAALVIFLWCRFRGIALFRRDGTLLPGMVVGLMFWAEFLAVYYGYEYTTAARGSLLLNTMPFWMLIGAHFLLGERMSLPKFLGLVLAFCGVVLVFADKISLPNPSAVKGDILCLIGGALWAATTLVIKKSKLVDTSPEKLLLYQLCVTVVLTLPMLAFGSSPFRDVTALATASLLFQAIYTVAFTFLLWFWLVRRYPAAGLSSFTFLTPAFGVLCGGLILGEPLGLRIFMALALIGAGLIIVNRPKERTA